MKQSKVINLRRARKARARQEARNAIDTQSNAPATVLESARNALEQRKLDAHRKHDET